MKRRAACSCGALSVETEGEPVRISVCHCLACQRRTGSAFGVQARFPVERTTVHGASTLFVRTGDDGGKASFHFCPTCGATVYYTLDDMPGVLAVPVGAFADPTFPAPYVAVYEVRRHPWVNLEGITERYD
jgi:hypothetical protein